MRNQYSGHVTEYPILTQLSTEPMRNKSSGHVTEYPVLIQLSTKPMRNKHAGHVTVVICYYGYGSVTMVTER